MSVRKRVAGTLTLVCMALLSEVEASELEYMVVFLPGSAAGAKVSKIDSGSYLDETKTAALNRFARDGWKVIAVTGGAGADHAVYLQRENIDGASTN